MSIRSHGSGSRNGIAAYAQEASVVQRDVRLAEPRFRPQAIRHAEGVSSFQAGGSEADAEVSIAFPARARYDVSELGAAEIRNRRRQMIRKTTE